MRGRGMDFLAHVASIQVGLHGGTGAGRLHPIFFSKFGRPWLLHTRGKQGPPTPLPSLPLRFPRLLPRHAPSSHFPHTYMAPQQLQQAAMASESHCNMCNTPYTFETFR